jgi:hypothetical protein
MKNIILLAGVVIVLGVIALSFLKPGADAPRTAEVEAENETEAELSGYGTYQNDELGFAFDYPQGKDGYAIKDVTTTDIEAGLVKLLQLQSLEHTTQGASEALPVISVGVFENTQKQWPEIWAEEHLQYSNINLKLGEVESTVVGGANAVQYRADGLYASENVVVAHGDYVYVITGQFIDEDSSIRQDYSPLVASFRFVPAPGQN